ncbi:uncharacterized protein LJ206_004673 isoform 2-T5 [Theristicus caerulescens]
MENPVDTDGAFHSELRSFFPNIIQQLTCLSPLFHVTQAQRGFLTKLLAGWQYEKEENQLDYTGKYLRKAELIAPITTGEPVIEAQYKGKKLKRKWNFPGTDCIC